eukprot:jgi/Mesen1/935/ME000118S00113
MAAMSAACALSTAQCVVSGVLSTVAKQNVACTTASTASISYDGACHANALKEAGRRSSSTSWPNHTKLTSVSRRVSLGCRASEGSETLEQREEGDGRDDLNAIRQRLEGSMQPSKRFTGKELRAAVVARYGRAYDVRLSTFNSKVYLQVMWRFLGQRSFHLSEEMYDEQLGAVAEFLSHWGVSDMVVEFLRTTKQRPGFTGGGGAKAVSIPLNVSRGQGRGQEWMDHF